MKRKTLLALSAIPLVLLLSSCFVLQGFWVVANQVAAGQATKVVFQIHPSTALDNDRGYQFFLVGVDDVNELKVGKATWGTNGTFGGPYQLPVSGALAGAVDSSGDCTSNGFDFSTVTGVTWKGYITPSRVNDRDKLNKEVIVQAGLKAKASATTGTDHFILGVTGMWIDDNGSGTPDGADIFYCSGFSQVNLTVT